MDLSTCLLITYSERFCILQLAKARRRIWQPSLKHGASLAWKWRRPEVTEGGWEYLRQTVADGLKWMTL